MFVIGFKIGIKKSSKNKKKQKASSNGIVREKIGITKRPYKLVNRPAV